MRKTIKITFYIFNAALLVVGLAGVPDDINTWENWIGRIFNMITPNQGRWLLVSFAVLLFLFFNVGLPYLSRKKEKAALATLKIISVNQSGGITAQHVNVGNTQRALVPELKKAILEHVDKERGFYLHVHANNPEAENLAYAIKEFLIIQNYRYHGMTGHSMSGGDGRVLLSKDSRGEVFITVGPNVTTDKALQFTGMATGLEDGDKISGIEFGKPLDHATESYLKWFHIPISLDEDGFFDRTFYERCKAQLIFSDKGGPHGDSLEMNRQSDAPCGDSEFSFDTSSSSHKIPIALRIEQSNPINEAYFSDKQFLEQLKREQLIPNAYEFRLKVVSPHKEWISPIYILNVPDYKDDNSTFNLVRKDD